MDEQEVKNTKGSPGRSVSHSMLLYKLPSTHGVVQAVAYDHLIASSVSVGWTPSRADLSDPAQNDPSKSSAALWEGRIQLHPDTKPDDPAYQRWGPAGIAETHQSKRDPLGWLHLRVLEPFHSSRCDTSTPPLGRYIPSTYLSIFPFAMSRPMDGPLVVALPH